MKKFLSLILAALMMLSIGTVAFAHENVDNTFDNYTPKLGETAPNNWYDPFSYDSEGHMLPVIGLREANFCLNCKKLSVVYTKIEGSDKYYHPYESEVVLADGSTAIRPYCPYCGLAFSVKTSTPNTCYTIGNDWSGFGDIYYGTICTLCGKKNASDNENFALNKEQTCRHCWGHYEADKFYRLVPQEALESEMGYLFEETEANFGDGKDGLVESIKFDNTGYVIDWEIGDDYHEPTFWEKFVQFFVSIGDFFVKLFTWSW